MARFFVSAEQISGNTAVIAGSDASHITRVLRKEPGDILTLCDGAAGLSAGLPGRDLRKSSLKSCPVIIAQTSRI